MAARLSVPTSTSFTVTRPALGRSSTGTMRIKVLLPAPEWPTRMANSPRAMVSDTPARAS